MDDVRDRWTGAARIYAGNTWNTALKVRLATLGGSIATLAVLVNTHLDPQLIAFGAFMSATLFEALTAGSSARKHGIELGLVPGFGHVTGLALLGRF